MEQLEEEMKSVNEQSVHPTLLARPSYSFFWPFCLSTRPQAPLCSIHSLESCFEPSWWVVLGMQVCTVGGAAASLLQTLPRHGVKPSPSGGKEQLQTGGQAGLSCTQRCAQAKPACQHPALQACSRSLRRGQSPHRPAGTFLEMECMHVALLRQTSQFVCLSHSKTTASSP